MPGTGSLIRTSLFKFTGPLVMCTPCSMWGLDQALMNPGNAG